MEQNAILSERPGCKHQKLLYHTTPKYRAPSYNKCWAAQLQEYSVVSKDHSPMKEMLAETRRIVQYPKKLHEHPLRTKILSNYAV